MRYSIVLMAVSTALLLPSIQAKAGATPPPAMHAKAKVFTIKPKETAEDFMCESGFIASVQAFDEGNTAVPVILLDNTKQPIPKDTWASASGFRLDKKDDKKIDVTLICGN